MKTAAILVLVSLLVLPMIVSLIMNVFVGIRDTKSTTKPDEIPPGKLARIKKGILVAAAVYVLGLFFSIIWAVTVFTDDKNTVFYISCGLIFLLYMAGLLVVYNKFIPLPKFEQKPVTDEKSLIEQENKWVDTHSANFLKMIKSWEFYVLMIALHAVFAALLILVGNLALT